MMALKRFRFDLLGCYLIYGRKEPLIVSGTCTIRQTAGDEALFKVGQEI